MLKFITTSLLAIACFAETASLSNVKKIYVEPMPNDLDQYIRAEFYKQMRGQITVVTEKVEADAILGGVSEEKKGALDQVTGRYLGLHDNATGSLNLLDKSGKVILWSGEAGDRSLMFGNFRRGGERKVAERLVSALKKELKRTD